MSTHWSLHAILIRIIIGLSIADQQGAYISTKRLSSNACSGQHCEEPAAAPDDEVNLMQVYHRATHRNAHSGKDGAHEGQASNTSALRSRYIEEAEEVAMIRIAKANYQSDDDHAKELLEPYGWSRISQFANLGVTKDLVGIYRHMTDNTCVVSFTICRGCIALEDDNGPQSYCGLDSQFFGGIVTHLQSMRENATFTQIEKYLNSTSCSSIYSIGHSAGSMMAEIFATCVNNDPTFYQMYKIPVIEKLYTFGAPAPSKVPLANQSTCLAGKRFYCDGDAFCGTMYNKGYRHPQLEAIRLTMDNSTGEATYSALPRACDSTAATEEPGYTGMIMNENNHSAEEYLIRLQALYR